MTATHFLKQKLVPAFHSYLDSAATLTAAHISKQTNGCLLCSVIVVVVVVVVLVFEVGLFKVSSPESVHEFLSLNYHDVWQEGSRDQNA